MNRCEHTHDDGSSCAAMGHSHGLTRGGDVEGVSDRRLLISVALNQLLTVGQVIAGIFSGSVSLLSDAAHNFSDANALLIAYIARRISRRESNDRYTFGYRRAELIGAIINLTLLAAIAVFLIYEALHRWFDPQPIIGWLMAAAAGLALAVDLGTAGLLWMLRRGSLNVRAAFMHNLVDAAASLVVLIGAAAVIWKGWKWVDPLLTLLIAGYILWQVAAMLPQATRILMEGTPVGFDLPQMIEQLEKEDEIIGIHHVHVWQLDEEHRSMEAHVVIERGAAGRLEEIKSAVKQTLYEQFEIQHSTLEFEFGTPGSRCGNPCILDSHSETASGNNPAIPNQS